MDWLVTLGAGAFFFLLLTPLWTLLLMLFVLVPLAHLAPHAPTLTRARFDCPLSGRTVNATFVTSPDAPQPTDVVECSLFADGRVRCKKGCLALAEVGWSPSPMVPRYALVADGVATR